MGQHLYPCQRPGCARVGLANYVLQPNTDADRERVPYILVRLCKGCWAEMQAEKKRQKRAAEAAN